MHSFQNRLRHNCNGNVRLFINSSGRIKKHIWIPTFLYTVEHSVIINKKSYLGLLLPQFAALSRTSTPQILPPPQNGAIVRTDSVRTIGYLQNFKTPIIH